MDRVEVAAGGERSGPAGVVVRSAKNGKTQVIRTGGKRWSEGAERVFLEVLGATCNVRAAAEAAGFSTTAIYRRRRLWAAFREAWDAAIDLGYTRIEMLLVERATDCLSGVAVPTEAPIPAMSVDQAMNMLKLHRATARGGAAQRYDAKAQAPDYEEVKARILRKIDAIERARSRRPALLVDARVEPASAEGEA